MMDRTFQGMTLLCNVACALLLLTALAWGQTQDPAVQRAPDSTKLVPITAVKAAYPYEAREKGMQGQVVVKIVVSETGDVEQADVVSGDPILAKSALQAARQWKFKPFIKNGEPIKVNTTLPFDFFFKGKLTDVSDSAGEAKRNDEGTVKRVRISQGVSQGLLVHKVQPVYPSEARDARIQGQVVLQAVIGTDGRLAKLTPISGHPLLLPAAIGAVQQWRYKPYYLNSQPVEVETLITVNFELR